MPALQTHFIFWHYLSFSKCHLKNPEVLLHVEIYPMCSQILPSDNVYTVWCIIICALKILYKQSMQSCKQINKQKCKVKDWECTEGSTCTKQASWEELQEINNKLSCELTVEPCRLVDLDKRACSFFWKTKKDFINEANTGKVMMQTFPTTGVLSCIDELTEWVFIHKTQKTVVWDVEYFHWDLFLCYIFRVFLQAPSGLYRSFQEDFTVTQMHEHPSAFVHFKGIVISWK